MNENEVVQRLQHTLQALTITAASADTAPMLSDGVLATLQRLLRELLSGVVPRHLRWINASVGQQVRMVAVGDVLYFQAATKYTRVVTADAEVLIRKPLVELQRELDPAVFWPIHRSTIVNAHAIGSAVRESRGRMHVRLKQRGDKLAVSEAYTHRFRQM